MTDGPKREPEIRGVAGYESPYPYLDRLQEKMEERLEHKVPAGGRFCGYCYARLRADDVQCAICDRGTGSEWAPVAEVPQEVLRAYLAKQKTEARWVYGGAFVGLIIASVLFVVMVTSGPGLLGHPALAFAVLIGGGYLLAQLTGPLIGGQFGYRRGARKRDEMWARWLAARDGSGEPPR